MKSFVPCCCVVWMSLLLAPGDVLAQTSAQKRPGTGGKPAATKTPAAESKPKVAPDAYPNVPAAMEALREGLTSNNRDLVIKSEGWLTLQKEKAVPALAEIIKADGTSVEMRIAACRALGRVGPAATPVLFETLSADSASAQMKLKATESLSYVRPSSQPIVDRLVEILRGDDARMRQVALQGLGRIGPPAKSSAGVLLEILNSTAESETMRGEAKRALKEVDPRRGLMGVAPKK